MEIPHVWGREIIITDRPAKVRLLIIRPGFSTSLHYHQSDLSLTLLEGSSLFEFAETQVRSITGQAFIDFHRSAAHRGVAGFRMAWGTMRSMELVQDIPHRLIPLTIHRTSVLEGAVKAARVLEVSPAGPEDIVRVASLGAGPVSAIRARGLWMEGMGK
jgi:hypothetical protein